MKAENFCMENTNSLQEIYNNLQKGGRYGEYYAMRFPGFWNVLFKTVGGNIGWNHYGESANKNTLENLEWILTVIFRMTADEFLSKYKLYTAEKMAEWETIASGQGRTDYRVWEN